MARFCFVCQQEKANEKFSGKGHRKGVCKTCQKMSHEDQKYLMMVHRIDDISWELFPGKRK